MSDNDLDFEENKAVAILPARMARAEARPVDEERYETATRVTIEPPRAFHGRVAPHSLEAEENLLSVCMIDGSEVIGKCLRARMSPASFYDPKHEIVFACLVDLYHRNAKIIDIAVVAEELKTRKQLEQVGGFAFLAQVSSRIPTTAQADFFVEKVREQALLRDVIRSATNTIEEAYGFTGGIDDFVDSTSSRLASVVNSARRELAVTAMPITSYDYPTKADPNVLLGSDDYLGRGGGMLFVSHAGAGKSSFIMDACSSWAIGEAWMGIICNGALKSLIIQAEDSDRYVGKVSSSFASVRSLTGAQRKQLGENCVIVKIRGTTGAAFFAELERLVAIHQPDLVVLNPIYLYAEGDISKSESAQPFLVGLDRVNREMRFGYILVHHTGKPQQKSPTGKRAELDDWETIYMGFGSSYLANWPRCSALIEPRPKENGRYWLKLGKGGSNAGVTRQVEQGAGFRLETKTRIAIRHSKESVIVEGVDRPAIYWEIDEDESRVEEAPKVESEIKSRRQSKFSVGDYREMFARECPNPEKRKGYNALHRAACDIMKIGGSSFNTLLREAIEEGVLKRTEGKYHLP